MLSLVLRTFTLSRRERGRQLCTPVSPEFPPCRFADAQWRFFNFTLSEILPSGSIRLTYLVAGRYGRRARTGLALEEVTSRVPLMLGAERSQRG